MNTVELLEKIASRLQADPALNAWCLETYGRAATIQFRVDVDDPPPVESYPLVAVILAEHERRNTSRDQVWDIVLGTCLRDEDTLLLAGADVRAGVLRIERLRELAEDAVLSPGLGKVEISGSVEQAALHPLYAAASVITITNK